MLNLFKRKEAITPNNDFCKNDEVSKISLESLDDTHKALNSVLTGVYNNTVGEEAIEIKDVSRLNSDLRVKMFTHTDIGGTVSAFLGYLTFANIDVEFCHTRDVDDTINTFLLVDRKYTDYDLIIVADVPLNAGTLETLDQLSEFSEGAVKTVYYNHQTKHLPFNESYKCAHIADTMDGIKISTPNILYKDFVDNYSLEPNEWIDFLVEKARLYTTWEWTTDAENKDNVSLGLATLCYNSGKKYFVKSLLEKYQSNSSLLSEADLARLIDLQAKYRQYLKEKSLTVVLDTITVDEKTYKVCFVSAEQFIGQIAEDIAAQYKNVDCVIILNGLSTYHFRRGGHSDTDLSEIASLFGGNGNSSSAAATISQDTRRALLTHMKELYMENYYK